MPALIDVRRLYDEWEQTPPAQRTARWRTLIEQLLVHPELARLRDLFRRLWPHAGDFSRVSVQAVADRARSLTGKNPPDVDAMSLDELNGLLASSRSPIGKSRKPSRGAGHEELVDRMRKLIASHKDGKKAATKTLINGARVRRRDALKALRTLEAAGEYTGFSRPCCRRSSVASSFHSTPEPGT